MKSTASADRARWPQRLAEWGERLVARPVWDRPVVRGVAVVIALLLFVTVAAVPLEFTMQMAFALSCVALALALVLRRVPGRLPILAMIVLSVLASLRYMYWRVTSTLGFESLIDAFFGFGLLLAELYALVTLLLGYFQTAWPLQRRPVPLPAELAQWPTVDVLIPTYNEPLSVVRQTVYSALAMDWPADKLKIYVLDDGRRAEFRAFCEQAGVGYVTRDNNRHAKAGNINAALARTDGEFVAIFDCDHIPTRSFLQITMGWFLRDPQLAMLQTPHVFFSPDPFEKNLGTFRTTPNEGELFYGLIQDGNDLWNASFFCGSCAARRCWKWAASRSRP
ncbi:MAG: Cellulose synthase catalytic subunit [UDP-forming] [Paracidovorax wautersii]|uniref:Cellulose synthase catalytic subunit [UDP-forming] n=1 Tax=Paracidovorax wautersii TaxID=1177982 RepID=A0A7V8FP32_9BURK|nr:MAG: Cellulose synthase catalytic subunit [UDP-forming] [Paracidovorax wautersii]